MKTNNELLYEVFNGINKEFGVEILSIKHLEDYLSIVYKDEEVVKVFAETLEEFDEPVKFIIDCFYEYNKRAKSKECVKRLEHNLNKIFKKILNNDKDEEILSLVVEAKNIKTEINSFKEDLEWTKEIARSLYLCRDLFNKKIEDEVE